MGLGTGLKVLSTTSKGWKPLIGTVRGLEHLGQRIIVMERSSTCVFFFRFVLLLPYHLN